MSGYRVGCYVLHSKLQELGSGEVVMIDKGAIRIRFASGERSFAEQKADPYLEVTAEAPLAPPPTARKRAPRKTAAKKAPKSPGTKASSAPAPVEAEADADD